MFVCLVVKIAKIVVVDTEYVMCICVTVLAESRQQLRLEHLLTSSGHVSEHSAQQVLSSACNEGTSILGELIPLVSCLLDSAHS